MQTQSAPCSASPVVIFRLGNGVVVSETAPCCRCGMACMINRLDYEEVVPYVPRDPEGFASFAKIMDLRILEEDLIDLSPVSGDQGGMICSGCAARLPHLASTQATHRLIRVTCVEEIKRPEEPNNV